MSAVTTVMVIKPNARVKMVKAKQRRAAHPSKSIRMTDADFLGRYNVAEAVMKNALTIGDGKLVDWKKAIADSGLSKSAIWRAKKRIARGESPRASHTGGRPAGISDWMQKRMEEVQRGRVMGDGYTLKSFTVDVEKFHVEESRMNNVKAKSPLNLDQSTLRKYLRRLFPESSFSNSTQNIARVNAALNGCTSITHAVNVYANAVVANQVGALWFNVDRCTIFPGQEATERLHYSKGQKKEAKRHCQGPSKAIPEGEKEQRRTVHVDFLSSTMSMDFCHTCIHMTDKAMPENVPPERIVYNPHTTIYVTHAKYSLEELYEMELEKDFIPSMERSQDAYAMSLKEADATWQQERKPDGSLKRVRAMFRFVVSNLMSFVFFLVMIHSGNEAY